MLPKSPSDEEKYLFVNQNRFFLYSFGCVSFALLVLGMVLFCISHPVFYFYGLVVALVVFYLSISYVIGLFGKSFNLKNHNEIISFYKAQPSVDVYLPSCGEDTEIVNNTLFHVEQLDWENKRVYVLDDKGSHVVRDLAHHYGFEYISRPDKGVLKKAGNLRNAFDQTSGEYIVIFDADFCPRPDFLKETIPYFIGDEKVAIVQTPQYFSVDKEQTWIEKGASNVQELFYRLIQVNRDTWDAAICVGTCAVYRRKALEPFGGTAAIGYSEDMHTGWNVMKAGWKIRYIPINLSKGMCPDNIQAFFTQQYRWAMGSTTLFLNKEFWKTKLSIPVRMCYLSGMLYYSATALGVFISQVPAMLLIAFYPQHVFWYNTFFSIPSLIFGTIYFSFWCKTKWGLYTMKSRQVSYYAHLFALVDKLRGDLMPWVPTGEVQKGKIGRFISFRNLLFWWTTFSTSVIVSGAAYRMAEYEYWNFIPTCLLAAFNYYVCMVVLRDQ